MFAFPCNQFGGPELGIDKEIVQIACTRFNAEYLIFYKVNVCLILPPSFFWCLCFKLKETIALVYNVHYDCFHNSYYI